MDAFEPKFSDLRDRTQNFGRRIIRLFRALPRAEEARVVGRQLLRSGTSIGANYRAACRARSLADFISKLGILLEEADESDYWLDLIVSEKMMPNYRLSDLQRECEELIRIFVSSLNTAEARRDKRKSKKAFCTMHSAFCTDLTSSYQSDTPAYPRLE